MKILVLVLSLVISSVAFATDYGIPGVTTVFAGEGEYRTLEVKNTSEEIKTCWLLVVDTEGEGNAVVGKVSTYLTPGESETFNLVPGTSVWDISCE